MRSSPADTVRRVSTKQRQQAWVWGRSHAARQTRNSVSLRGQGSATAESARRPSLTSWKNRLAGPWLSGACAGAPDSRTLTLLGGKATAARAPVRSGRAERDQPARSVEPRGLGRPVVRVRGFGIAPPLLPTVGRSAAQNIGRASLLCAEDLPIFETESDRFLGRSNPVGNAKLSEDCGHVVIHGFRRHDQALGDVGVA